MLGLAASAADTAQPVTVPSLEVHEVVDGLGRTVRFRLSHPVRPAPLLLMIQGSGCAPVLYDLGDGRLFNSIFNLGVIARDERFTVLAVDKPDAQAFPGQANGQAAQCSAAFNQGFTAERWLLALQAAIAEARRMPWVAPGRSIVLGHSEGAVMAAMVAGHDAAVTDVIAFGSSGTSQLFDFIVNAYRCFDPSRCLADIDAQLRAIQSKPDSAEDFAWGHPYKRWTSFFRVSPLDELRRSKARVYLASGTADLPVPILSTEVLAAGLLADGRDVTMRRVPNADHNLSTSDGQWGETAQEYSKALDWVWQRR